jgi:hypothetical protein
MSKAKTVQGVFRIFYLVEAGKDANGKHNVRRVYFDGEFAKRTKARNWLRNNPSKVTWYIEHPDGKTETATTEDGRDQ